MKFLRQLLVTELAALVALVLAALLLSALVALSPGQPILGGLAGFKAVFASTLVFGVVPVVVFAAPAYAVLQHYSEPSWLTVLVFGVFPGAAFMAVDVILGFLGVACGIFVASTTHIVSRVCSNYVSKRTCGEMSGSSETLSAAGRLTRC